MQRGLQYLYLPGLIQFVVQSLYLLPRSNTTSDGGSQKSQVSASHPPSHLPRQSKRASLKSALLPVSPPVRLKNVKNPG